MRANNVNDCNKGTSSGTLYGTLNNGLRPVLAINAVLNDLNDVSVEGVKKGDILYNDGLQWTNGSIVDVLSDCDCGCGTCTTLVLDGGNAFGHSCEPVEPVYDTYADETVDVLNTLINGVEFQRMVALIDGVDAMNMSSNTINMAVSKKFVGVLDAIYSNEKVSEMMGRIVSTIYNNINYGNIRHSIDELETDMWIEFDNAQNGDLMETKVFIYYSDESFNFLKFRFRFVK